MTVAMLEEFFMWCTILNGATLFLSSLLCICARDWVYRIHKKVFDIERDAFINLLEAFIAIYKIFFMTFNLFPYVALLLMRS